MKPSCTAASGVSITPARTAEELLEKDGSRRCGWDAARFLKKDPLLADWVCRRRSGNAGEC